MRTASASGTLSTTSCNEHVNMETSKGQSGQWHINRDTSDAVQEDGKDFNKKALAQRQGHQRLHVALLPTTVPCSCANTCLRTMLSMTY